MPRIRLENSALPLCLVLGLVLAGRPSDGAGEPSTSERDKPPDRWTLPVVLRPQETELWCWAATGQMAMEFLGKSIAQGEVVNLVLHRDDCGRHPAPGPCVKGGSVVLTPFGFQFDLSPTPLSESELVRQLYTLRRPVPFSWQFPGGGGHASLAVGYARTPDGSFLVECLDPWPPPGKDRRDWAGGQRVFMPYARWAKDYDHYFGGAMYNVARKP
jgi:hypothetical protein